MNKVINRMKTIAKKVEKLDIPTIEKDGCPCNGNCCDDPEPMTPDHECSDSCDECYCSECVNCGGYCCCDL